MPTNAIANPAGSSTATATSQPLFLQSPISPLALAASASAGRVDSNGWPLHSRSATKRTICRSQIAIGARGSVCSCGFCDWKLTCFCCCCSSARTQRNGQRNGTEPLARSCERRRRDPSGSPFRQRARAGFNSIRATQTTPVLTDPALIQSARFGCGTIVCVFYKRCFGFRVFRGSCSAHCIGTAPAAQSQSPQTGIGNALDSARSGKEGCPRNFRLAHLTTRLPRRVFREVVPYQPGGDANAASNPIPIGGSEAALRHRSKSRTLRSHVFLSILSNLATERRKQ